MQTEVSTDSLDDSTRRLLGDGVVFRIAYNTRFQTHSHKTVGSNKLLRHNRLQVKDNVRKHMKYYIFSSYSNMFVAQPLDSLD